MDGPALSLIPASLLFDGEGDKQTERGIERVIERLVSLKPPSSQGKMLRLDDCVGYERREREKEAEREMEIKTQSFILISKFDLSCLIYHAVIFVTGSCHS